MKISRSGIVAVNSSVLLLCLLVKEYKMFGQSLQDLPSAVQSEYSKLMQQLEYNKDIRPILGDKCFVCHGNDKGTREAGLRLDIMESALGPLPNNPDKVAITPGNRQKSEVYHRILSDDKHYQMPDPKSNLSLSDKEKAILIKWIDEGAKYQLHWSFIKSGKIEVPIVKNTSWISNAIDNFILKKLELESLIPSKPAAKEMLLRRLSFDLTGLPPSIQELDEFINDVSKNAYEKQVDRLLQSPHYGEKMAIDWLDIARFADSHGYTVDRIRDMSPYRDWVIQAYHSNLPYNLFVQHQLAGDLIPHATKDMKIATAFNRIHPMNMEGGIIEEEFQTEYVIDRTNTFGTAFMGLSLGCARCHDHKFDPWSQKNYYELFSFFNNVKEAGQIAWNDAVPTPTLLLPTKEQEEILAFIDESIKTQEQRLKDRRLHNKTEFKSWLSTWQYKNLTKELIPLVGLQGHFNFEDSLRRAFPINHSIKIRRETDTTGYPPRFERNEKGLSLKLDGDEYLDCGKLGIFRKSEPFAIGIRLKLPKTFQEGVIFHKSIAERLYNFRGYQLYFKHGKFEINMAHTGPSNAITRISKSTVPKDQWLQMTMTYDGSSRADGFNLFMNGEELEMITTMDQLYKDILFFNSEEPGLQIGGWWRGLGFKDGLIDDVTIYNRCLTELEIKVLAGATSWKKILTKLKRKSNSQELNAFKEYFDHGIDSTSLYLMEKLKALRTAWSDSSEYIPEVMVMQEMPSPKKAHVLIRGNYDALGEEVHPEVPSSISPFPSDFPKNRLGLSKWLTDGQHPLTARVAVNRLWQIFFGQGLVKSSEDFGTQGALPSHSELLDWLANEFVQSGWDIKKMNKLIVMSASYRQDSYVSPILREKDPENNLIARGPSRRLSAEMLRDHVLCSSGLLNPDIGGKSVKPYQPTGLWEINNSHYTTDTNQSLYRRSLYILIKRSVPNPSLTTFDAQDRSYCIARRQDTNTPLQALVTWNDPTFTEAAKVLGEKITNYKDSREGIRDIYRKLTSQTPDDPILDLLMELQKVEYEKFSLSPSKTDGWLNQGLYKVDAEKNKALLVANSIIASTIINSVASMYKK